MAINIYHSHSDEVTIFYYGDTIEGKALTEKRFDTMDKLAEHMVDKIVKHNFILAMARSNETGEVLITVKRS